MDALNNGDGASKQTVSRPEPGEHLLTSSQCFSDTWRSDEHLSNMNGVGGRATGVSDGGVAAGSTWTANVFYYGSLNVDRRWLQNHAMLPWLMAEVKNSNLKRPVRLTIEMSYLVISPNQSDSNEEQIVHKLHNISKFTRLSVERHPETPTFAYVERKKSKDASSDLSILHVFHATIASQIEATFQQITKAVKDNPDPSAIFRTDKPLSSLGDISDAHRFEVMYLAKAPVHNRCLSEKDIDKMIAKVYANNRDDNGETGAARNAQAGAEGGDTRRRHSSGTSVTSLPAILDYPDDDTRNSACDFACADRISSTESLQPYDLPSENEPLHGILKRSNTISGTDGRSALRQKTVGFRDLSDTQLATEEQKTRVRHPSTEKNNAMLMLINTRSLRLVSLDMKSIKLDKKISHISHCVQSEKRPDHFGIISEYPEEQSQNSQRYCFLFRSANKEVACDILASLDQAFKAAFEMAKSNKSCVQCPTVQFANMLKDLANRSDDELLVMLDSHYQVLDEDDQLVVRSKLNVLACECLSQSNENMVACLRQLCEIKQRDHVHISDGGQTGNQFLFSDSAKEKVPTLSGVKRSLITSINNLLRPKSKPNKPEPLVDRKLRSGSESSSVTTNRDSDGDSPPFMSPLMSPVRKEVDYDSAFNDNEAEAEEDVPLRSMSPPPRPRARSSTIGTILDYQRTQQETKMFPKNNNVTPSRPSIADRHVGESPRLEMMRRVSYHSDALSPMLTPMRRRESHRLQIFNRVVTPSGAASETTQVESDTTLDTTLEARPSRFHEPEDVRRLWRKTIEQQIALLQMERENRKLQARQSIHESSFYQRLDYEEVTPCLKEVTQVWNQLLAHPERPKVKFDAELIMKSMKKGVPKSKRGAIWKLLIEHDRLTRPDRLGPTSSFPAIDEPYHELLKQLTPNQHAILTDLGRTFPNHQYFSAPLGQGQLSLFNLLKAYSLIDTEVGYCQGLSFVAAVLIMHMSENDAFETFKYLLFNLGFRRQYKPDMEALQVQMYQLERLIHDQHQELYQHFQNNDIGPTLYAAPWFLTMFASQFPLGFVARVFDLIFIEGIEVVFKVALALLSDHKPLILQCGGFESIVHFLKTDLPDMTFIQMEKIINKVFEMDISRHLQAYEVEYHVLQEEVLMAPQLHMADERERIQQLETACAQLRRRNLELLEQIQQERSLSNSTQSKLQTSREECERLNSRLKTAEIERLALLNTIGKLKELIPQDKLEELGIALPNVETHDDRRHEERSSLLLTVPTSLKESRSADDALSSALLDGSKPPSPYPSTGSSRSRYVPAPRLRPMDAGDQQKLLQPLLRQRGLQRKRSISLEDVQAIP